MPPCPSYRPPAVPRTRVPGRHHRLQPNVCAGARSKLSSHFGTRQPPVRGRGARRGLRVNGPGDASGFHPWARRRYRMAALVEAPHPTWSRATAGAARRLAAVTAAGGLVGLLVGGGGGGPAVVPFPR